jgi:peptidase M50B-like protein
VPAVKNTTRVFVASVTVTALLYALPIGRTLAWPLVLVSTLAHELGHGLAAAILGGRFESLVIYQDASGAAYWSGTLGRVATATVAAAGLVGPAAAAFALLAFGRTDRGARILLAIVAATLVGVTLLLVRNPFGMAFTAVLAASLIAVMVWAPRASQGVIVFLAVQLGLSVFSRGDYLFTRSAVTASGVQLSDVGVMSRALVLPYWFWGALSGALSVILLAAGFKLFFRR